MITIRGLVWQAWGEFSLLHFSHHMRDINANTYFYRSWMYAAHDHFIRTHYSDFCFGPLFHQ